MRRHNTAAAVFALGLAIAGIVGLARCAGAQEPEQPPKGQKARNEITRELLIWDGTAWVSPLGEEGRIGRFAVAIAQDGTVAWEVDSVSGSLRVCALSLRRTDLPAVGPLCTGWVASDAVTLNSIGTARTGEAITEPVR